MYLYELNVQYGHMHINLVNLILYSVLTYSSMIDTNVQFISLR